MSKQRFVKTYGSTHTHPINPEIMIILEGGAISSILMTNVASEILIADKDKLANLGSDKERAGMILNGAHATRVNHQDFEAVLNSIISPPEPEQASVLSVPGPTSTGQVALATDPVLTAQVATETPAAPTLDPAPTPSNGVQIGPDSQGQVPVATPTVKKSGRQFGSKVPS